jgi:carbon-monoxide dehydrogenase small subunit
VSHNVEVVINGTRHELAVPDRWTLADLLREGVGLTGTRLGCEHGSCGSCTVLCDGASIRSCLELAARVHGSEILTVEGHATADGLSRVQQAFHEHHALQCGFCTAGFLASATEYVMNGGAHDEASVRDALAGNLCRCTGYQGIVDAVLSLLEEQG